jgi:hypothetical protein
MRTFPRIKRFRTLLPAAALLLTGCLTGGEPDRIGGDVRFFENGIYTDTELGYSLRVPAGWKVRVDSNANALFNFEFARQGTTITGWYFDLDPLEPLEAYVAHRTGEWSLADSEVVRPVEMRGGVAVIAVDTWDAYSEWDPEESDWVLDSYERERTLYFVRAGKMVTIRFTNEGATSASDADFAAIDSSLTFF